ncbi:MAG: GH3 auxin-responsive promoter family protein [Phycisphaerae bacterium]|nr:GH3 auxin-responsive promoter family protein [Phycisphaerae bacterium]
MNISVSLTPAILQKQLLMEIITNNRDTAYGREYGFHKIDSIEDFQNNVPVNQYHNLEPYIEKMLNGHENILTADMPVMFNLTSGTASKPKFIPVTAKTQKKTDIIMAQWLSKALEDHPDFMDYWNLIITSAPVEGNCPSGIPFGSMSGKIYDNLPENIMSKYVLSPLVAKIENYELRYCAMIRLALEKEVSFIATPNPTTLLRLAKSAIQYQQEIIKSINDGCLFDTCELEINEHDLSIVKSIETDLKPNKIRAEFLSNIIKKYDRLLPRYCWDKLTLIGCWLGGSVGQHADKLTEYYGNVPRRDLGYLASEGIMTLPYQDNTAAGVLALRNNFYEFVEVGSELNCESETLLAHELEKSKFYKVLLTNESGLYRYDINDIIKVETFYNQIAVIAFARKTSEIINITGEKLHLNQLMFAMKQVQVSFDIVINYFRIVPNHDCLRHDIFLAIESDVSVELLEEAVLPEIVKCLSDNNIEYEQKIKSSRLNPPCFFIMDARWYDDVRKEHIVSGKRDIQYKWQFMCADYVEADRKYIKHVITLKGK